MITTRQRRATEAPSDSALVVGCRAGDPAAWRALVLRYEGLVYSFPIRGGLAPEDAADITQTTFSHLLRSLHAIRKPESVGGWLCTVAQRLTWQAIARRDLELPTGLAVGDAVGSDTIGGVTNGGVTVTDDAIDALASQQWIHQAIVQLPEPSRTVVLQLFFNPTPPSYEELAILVDRPIGSIGPLRARALAKLRRLLEEPPERPGDGTRRA